MRLTNFDIYRAFIAHARRLFGRLVRRLDAPPAQLCDQCDGLGRDNWQIGCHPCRGRGWVPVADPLALWSRVSVFAALLGSWTLLLLAVAP